MLFCAAAAAVLLRCAALVAGDITNSGGTDGRSTVDRYSDDTTREKIVQLHEHDRDFDNANPNENNRWGNCFKWSADSFESRSSPRVGRG